MRARSDPCPRPGAVSAPQRGAARFRWELTPGGPGRQMRACDGKCGVASVASLRSTVLHRAKTWVRVHFSQTTFRILVSVNSVLSSLASPF